MKNLRPLSPRPELVVDQQGRANSEPAATVIPDIPGLLGFPVPPLYGRFRVVSALPLRDGPVWIVKPQALAAPDGTLVADPDDALVGDPGIKIDRLIRASKSLDERSG